MSIKQRLIHSLESYTHIWMVEQIDRQTNRLKNGQTPSLPACKTKGEGKKDIWNAVR